MLFHIEGARLEVEAHAEDLELAVRHGQIPYLRDGISNQLDNGAGDDNRRGAQREEAVQRCRNGCEEETNSPRTNCADWKVDIVVAYSCPDLEDVLARATHVVDWGDIDGTDLRIRGVLKQIASDPLLESGVVPNYGIVDLVEDIVAQVCCLPVSTVCIGDSISCMDSRSQKWSCLNKLSLRSLAAWFSVSPTTDSWR